MSEHVVILGAGFAGLELTTRLADALADEVRVTLIDQNEAFFLDTRSWTCCSVARRPPTS